MRSDDRCVASDCCDYERSTTNAIDVGDGDLPRYVAGSVASCNSRPRALLPARLRSRPGPNGRMRLNLPKAELNRN